MKNNLVPFKKSSRLKRLRAIRTRTKALASLSLRSHMKRHNNLFFLKSLQRLLCRSYLQFKLKPQLANYCFSFNFYHYKKNLNRLISLTQDLTTHQDCERVDVFQVKKRWIAPELTYFLFHSGFINDSRLLFDNQRELPVLLTNFYKSLMNPELLRKFSVDFYSMYSFYIVAGENNPINHPLNLDFFFDKSQKLPFILIDDILALHVTQQLD